MKWSVMLRAAIHEPKKLAAFRILPIGKVFTYIFFFIFLFTIISFARFLLSGNFITETASPELQAFAKAVGLLIYPMAFVMQFVISTMYIFIRICSFAYIGSLLLKVMKKRSDYRWIFRTAAVASTVPLLATLVFDFFPAEKPYSLVATSIVHMIYIALAAKYYPKAAA